jgi:hypothetical protein
MGGGRGRFGADASYLREKNTGFGIGHLVTSLAILSVSPGWPLPSSQLSWAAILQGSSFWVMLSLSALFVVLYFLLRNPSHLTIDESGVSLRSRWLSYALAWSDIKHVTPINGSVRIVPTGLPDDEGVMISKRFRLKEAQLIAILREGMARWGGEPSGAAVFLPESGRTAITRFAMRQLMWLMGIIALGLFTYIVIWQMGDHAKTLQLQKHGVQADAAIVRIYKADCSQHGCSINVEYAYSTTDGNNLHGHAYLTGDDNLGDPDYLYAKSHRTIPIVFDATHPEVSALNFKNRVFRSDTLVGRLGIIAFMLVLILISVGIVLVPVLIALRWQIRKATRARAAA